MTLQEFFDEQNGKINNNGSYEGQCVNLIHSYFSEVLMRTPFVGNAVNYWTQPISGFNKIPYHSGLIPEPGDIVVWNIVPDGHIGIVQWSRISDFCCMEQNNPIGSPCHYQDHSSYEGVLGFLRPLPTFLTLEYTGVNAQPTLMEQARRILLQDSGGMIDVVFTYIVDPRTSFTQDEQTEYFKTHATNRCVYFFYSSSGPYAQMQTAVAPGTNKIVTAATSNNTDPLWICYEFVNAAALFINRPDLIQDLYQPNAGFVQSRVNELIEPIRSWLAQNPPLVS